MSCATLFGISFNKYENISMKSCGLRRIIIYIFIIYSNTQYCASMSCDHDYISDWCTPGVGGAFLHPFIGFVEWALAPHAGFDGRFVIVTALVVQVPETLQRLRRRRPAVRRRPRRKAFMRGGNRRKCGCPCYLGVIWRKKDVCLKIFIYRSIKAVIAGIDACFILTVPCISIHSLLLQAY